MQSAIAPFRVSPNPNLLYITPPILGTLDDVRLAIDNRQGLSCILGDNGIGKSSVLRYLLSEYSADGYTTALLNHTEYTTPFAFLKGICYQFSEDLKPLRSMAAQYEQLEDWLGKQFGADKTVILFIDEGQRLDAEKLEVIRALLNCETEDYKLLQIVLAGTLELRDRIVTKRNKGLFSRVFSPCMLQPLSPEQTAAMIEFRCARAGLRNPFEPAALGRVYAHSRGIPRPALILCAHAYTAAQKAGMPSVTDAMVDSVAERNRAVAAA